MNVKSCIENKEQFSAVLIVEISAEEFEAALERAYKKSRGSISVPGFRKGKAPRKVIEGMYGSGVFYQDAIEDVYPDACDAAIKEKGLDIAAAPQIEIVDAGKEGLIFQATVTLRPQVDLDSYKGIEADKVLATVTDAAVEEELKTYIERATRLEAVDRAADHGDTANIDFEGFKEGIPFNGGKGENFDLLLGSGSFIPGFEDQVVGMKPGETREISVTFPEDYQAEELAGKPAMFRVKLNECKAKVVPTLDDEFAKDVSEFETLEAFKEDLRAKVADRNMGQADARFKQNVLDKLAAMVTVDLPKPMVESQIDRIMSDYANRLENQGISMEMYLSYMQLSEQLMREELRPAAEKQIRTQIALDAVVRAEKVEISDETVTDELTKIAESMQITLAEVEGVLSRDSFKRDFARDKAMEIVIAAAVPRLISEEEALADMQVEEVKADEEPKEKPAKKPRAKKAAEPAEEGAEAPKKAPAKKTTKKKAEATEE